MVHVSVGALSGAGRLQNAQIEGYEGPKRERARGTDVGSGTSKATEGSVASVGGQRFGCAFEATCHSIKNLISFGTK